MAMVNTVVIKDPLEKVLVLIGKPLRETTLGNDVVVLTYTSLAPSVSDYVYIKENKVILVSESYFRNSKTTKQLLPEIKNPDAVYSKSSGIRKESKESFFTVWFKEGIAVETETNSMDAQVLRLLRFLPMEENAFISLCPSSSTLRKINVVSLTTLDQRENLLPQQKLATILLCGTSDWE